MLTYNAFMNVLQRVRYIPNGRGREVNRGSTGLSSAAAAVAIPGPPSPGMLSSMLAAASPEQQKQILGERLYPLVSNHKVHNVFLKYS